MDRNSQPASSMWHCKMGCATSLCGLNPARGEYNIATFSSFFTAPDKLQCKTCLKHIKKRGYNIADLRLRYRAVYDRAQKVEEGQSSPEMQPYLKQARNVLNNHA